MGGLPPNLLIISELLLCEHNFLDLPVANIGLRYRYRYRYRCVLQLEALSACVPEFS